MHVTILLTQCQPIRIPHATVTTWMRSWASDSKQGEQQENNQTPTEEAPEPTQGDAAAEQAAPEADPKDEEIARYKEEVGGCWPSMVHLQKPSHLHNGVTGGITQGQACSIACRHGKFA